MAPNNVDRYWAGVGPKCIPCNNPSCTTSIYTGVLVHRKLKLGLKPVCFVCRREYKIPPGAEKPYLKGGNGSPPNTSTRTGPRKWGGDDKDKEIAKLQKIIQDKGIALPDSKPSNEQKALLEKCKLTRTSLVDMGVDTSTSDAKILELEAANKTAEQTLPSNVVEAKLRTAQLKLQRHITRHTNLENQILECQRAGAEALQHVEELEVQLVKALAAKGYEPIVQPEAKATDTEQVRIPPAHLKQEQKEEWTLAVQNNYKSQRNLLQDAV